MVSNAATVTDGGTFSLDIDVSAIEAVASDQIELIVWVDSGATADIFDSGEDEDDADSTSTCPVFAGWYAQFTYYAEKISLLGVTLADKGWTVLQSSFGTSVDTATLTGAVLENNWSLSQTK